MVANIPDTTNPVAGSLSLVVDSSTQITVSISGQSDNVGIDHIVLQRSPNGTDTWSTLSSDTTFPYADSGLTASTTYYYRATVYDAAGNNATTANASDTTSVAAGFTHYVSPTGTASTWAEATNISTPASISFAMANAVAGNVVAFRGGTYTIDRSGTSDWTIPRMHPTNSGTSGNPITFINYTGETPTLVGTGATTDELDQTFAGCTTGNAWIVWDGFTTALSESSPFDGTGGYNTNFGFYIYGASNCIVRNFTATGVVNGTPSSGGNTAPIGLQASTSCTIENCTISGNTGGTDPNTVAIWSFANVSCTIKNNNMHSCNNGFAQKTGPNQGVVVELNNIYNMTFSGVRISEESTSATACYIRNNLINNCGTGVEIEGSSATFIARDWNIYNNTIVHCSVGIFTGADVSGTVAYNNIIYDATTELRIDFTNGFGATTLNYNCYGDAAWVWEDGYFGAGNPYTSLSAWQTFTSLEANSFTGSPTFTVGTGTTPTNYTLDTGSNCLSTGSGGVNVGVLDLTQVGVQ